MPVDAPRHLGHTLDHTLDHRLVPAPLATVVADVVLDPAAAAVALLSAELLAVGEGRVTAGVPCRVQHDVVNVSL